MYSKTVLICIAIFFLSISAYFASMAYTTIYPTEQNPINDFPGYTLILGDTANEIWDNERFVGFIPVDTCSKLDQLMIKDNE